MDAFADVVIHLTLHLHSHTGEVEGGEGLTRGALEDQVEAAPLRSKRCVAVRLLQQYPDDIE